MTRRFGIGRPSASRRTVVLAIPFILGGLAIGCGMILFQTAGTGTSTARTALASSVDRAPDAGAARTAVPVGAETVAAFPLVVKPGRRYLEDTAGTPFLIHGDSPWGLIGQLTREDVDRYLDDRCARGFNTILVRLIDSAFSTNAPENAYGQLPFLVPGDFSTPNEAYFAHADWVLRRAAEKGFLVLLTPSYTGWGGSEEGWYRAMVANGPDRMRQYGEYLGRRYHDFSNILWVHAGDFNPPKKDLVRAIAEAIRKFDPRALHTAHAAPETAAIDYWQGEPWLQVNSVYTYKPVYVDALEQYSRPGRMPFFLIESAYENEHGATEQRLRTQAYQAVLSGAAGQVFGNNPIWHFDGRGLYPAPMTWQEALGSRGAQSMTHLRNLLVAVPWWLLEPDADHILLTGGLGNGGEHAVAARAVDGSFAILYLPTYRDITVDLQELAGPQVAARWYDPSDGEFLAVDKSPLPAKGLQQFTLDPDTNRSGFDDWILLLESRS